MPGLRRLPEHHRVGALLALEPSVLPRKHLHEFPWHRRPVAGRRRRVVGVGPARSARAHVRGHGPRVRGGLDGPAIPGLRTRARCRAALLGGAGANASWVRSCCWRSPYSRLRDRPARAAMGHMASLAGDRDGRRGPDQRGIISCSAAISAIQRHPGGLPAAHSEAGAVIAELPLWEERQTFFNAPTCSTRPRTGSGS